MLNNIYINKMLNKFIHLNIKFFSNLKNKIIQKLNN